MDNKLENSEDLNRLNNEGALLYQDFATKKEGLDFNQVASTESYAEAQLLVDKLKAGNFNWVGIDWNNVNFSKGVSLSEAEVHLDTIIKHLNEYQHPDDGSLLKILQKFRHTTIPLILSLSLISGCSAPKTPEDARAIKVAIELSEYRDANIHLDRHPDQTTYYDDLIKIVIKKWWDVHPEITSVRVVSVHISDRGNRVSSDLEITLANGQKIRGYGSQKIGSFDFMDSLQVKIDKIMPSDGHDPRDLIGYSLYEALNTCEKQIVKQP